MGIHQSFVWFRAIEVLVLEIHNRVYQGNRNQNRYRLGPNYIVEVNNNRMVAIHDFETRKSVRVFHDEINLSTVDNVSSLAETITNQIPAAIQAISKPDVYEIYRRAGRLNITWVDTRFKNIIKNLVKY